MKTLVTTFTLLLCCVSVRAGNPVFAPPVNFTTGKTPIDLCVGHFNYDPAPDVAVLNQGDSSVSVFMGAGGGVFALGVKYGIGYNQGIVPTGIVAADLNGDGRDDLIVSCGPANAKLQVLMNNGTGVFGAAQGYKPGNNGSSSVCVGLFDWDTYLDLVATAAFTNISMLKGNGNGTFGVSNYIGILNDGGYLTSADLDLDLNADLVACDPPAGSFYFLKGNGLGVFSYGSVNSTPVGTQPLNLCVADLNDDGVPDVATANNPGGNISVFINNGNGTFSAPANFVAQGNPTSICAADFNHDGRTDLAVSHLLSSSGVSVFTNLGGGTMADPLNFPSGNDARRVQAVDLSPDGWPDLVVVNSSSDNFSVLMNMAVTSCCTDKTGNVDCDAGDHVDISDLSALIDNLYISFTPLCCSAEANIDGQPGIDISDLSALIDYLYITFTPTAACQ